MMIFLQIVFWVSVLAIVHSYVIYPLILKILALNKKPNELVYSNKDEFPDVIVMLSAFNEETVITEKFDTMLNSDYPMEKLSIWVGSDASSDGTDEILKIFQEKYSNVHFYRFDDRGGKANVLNKLYQKIIQNKAPDSRTVLILTDANVMFSKTTIREMVKHFKNPEIGQVGAQIINKGMKPSGISRQEQFYISRENQVKYNEGLVWGTMMGGFGACYAMRANLFISIPSNFLMEDYFLSMHILSTGKKAIHEMNALCYEDIPNEISVEYNRKRRISAGNFQNLSVYKRLLWPPYKPLGFSFLSHKVLRWYGPLFMILAYTSSFILMFFIDLYFLIFLSQTILLIVPLFDRILKKVGIHSIILRFISYFLYMNLALFEGLIVYLKGVKTNVWQPTKRINE